MLKKGHPAWKVSCFVGYAIESVCNKWVIVWSNVSNNIKIYLPSLWSTYDRHGKDIFEVHHTLVFANKDNCSLAHSFSGIVMF